MPLSSKLGWLLFAGLLVYFLSGYGSRWEFGRCAMPSTLLAADGEHHPDGSEVDAVTLALARSGYEQEAYLLLLGIMVAIWVVGGWLIWRRHQQHRARLEELRRLYEGK